MEPSPQSLSNTVDLYRFGGTQDPDGGVIASYTLIASSVPCSVQPDDPMRFLDEKTGRIIQKTAYSVFFATNYGLKADDKIVWADDLGNTRTIFVFGVDNEAGKNSVFVANCEERQ